MLQLMEPDTMQVRTTDELSMQRKDYLPSHLGKRKIV